MLKLQSHFFSPNRSKKFTHSWRLGGGGKEKKQKTPTQLCGTDTVRVYRTWRKTAADLLLYYLPSVILALHWVTLLQWYIAQLHIEATGKRIKFMFCWTTCCLIILGWFNQGTISVSTLYCWCCLSFIKIFKIWVFCADELILRYPLQLKYWEALKALFSIAEGKEA